MARSTSSRAAFSCAFSRTSRKHGGPGFFRGLLQGGARWTRRDEVISIGDRRGPACDQFLEQGMPRGVLTTRIVRASRLLGPALAVALGGAVVDSGAGRCELHP